jgi:putative aldouronate transport system permease protein
MGVKMSAEAVKPAGRGKSPARRRIVRLRNSWQLLLMCSPAIVFFLIFSYAPMPGVYVAFTDYNYANGIFGSPLSQPYGFGNFLFLFRSGELGWLLLRTVAYNIVFILVGSFMQMAVAILLNEIRSIRFRRITQSIIFLPYFISAVLVGLFVYNLINYDYGFISSTVRNLGGKMPRIYSAPWAWPFVILFVYLWQNVGYGSVIYFAAIMGIDSTILEVARVDGANGFQRIRHIILPNLRQTFVILLLFSLGGIVRGNFGLFYNLVGLNSMLYPTTDIIETFVYRSVIRTFNFSQGSAVGLFQSVVGFGIVLISNWLVKRVEPDYALF